MSGDGRRTELQYVSRLQQGMSGIIIIIIIKDICIALKCRKCAAVIATR